MIKCDCKSLPHKFGCESRRNDNINVAIQRMCEYAGVDYYMIDFNDPEWYHQHTMTKLQEVQYKQWLCQFLLCNWRGILKCKPRRMKDISKAVDEFIFMWGFKVNKEVN